MAAAGIDSTAPAARAAALGVNELGRKPGRLNTASLPSISRAARARQVMSSTATRRPSRQEHLYDPIGTGVAEFGEFGLGLEIDRPLFR
jgi:hypothetical protein